ncbi:hypothetical protein [Burkholderia gladioli]|nr:hypothetical protein [Burkholderia gladioli]
MLYLPPGIGSRDGWNRSVESVRGAAHHPEGGVNRRNVKTG